MSSQKTNLWVCPPENCLEGGLAKRTLNVNGTESRAGDFKGIKRKERPERPERWDSSS